MDSNIAQTTKTNVCGYDQGSGNTTLDRHQKAFSVENQVVNI